MSGRPQDTLRKVCGKFADRRALTVVKEVTSTKTFLPSVVNYAETWPATCFACGGLFDPAAYGFPKLRCRVCELIGIEIQPEGRKG